MCVFVGLISFFTVAPCIAQSPLGTVNQCKPSLLDENSSSNSNDFSLQLKSILAEDTHLRSDIVQRFLVKQLSPVDSSRLGMIVSDSEKELVAAKSAVSRVSNRPPLNFSVEILDTQSDPLQSAIDSGEFQNLLHTLSVNNSKRFIFVISQQDALRLLRNLSVHHMKFENILKRPLLALSDFNFALEILTQKKPSILDFFQRSTTPNDSIRFLQLRTHPLAQIAKIPLSIKRNVLWNDRNNGIDDKKMSSQWHNVLLPPVTRGPAYNENMISAFENWILNSPIAEVRHYILRKDGKFKTWFVNFKAYYGDGPNAKSPHWTTMFSDEALKIMYQTRRFSFSPVTLKRLGIEVDPLNEIEVAKGRPMNLNQLEKFQEWVDETPPEILREKIALTNDWFKFWFWNFRTKRSGKPPMPQGGPESTVQTKPQDAIPGWWTHFRVPTLKKIYQTGKIKIPQNVVEELGLDRN